MTKLGLLKRFDNQRPCLQQRRFAAASGETITLLELGDARVPRPLGVLPYRAYAA
jgi:hypothetical protein